MKYQGCPIHQTSAILTYIHHQIEEMDKHISFERKSIENEKFNKTNLFTLFKCWKKNHISIDKKKKNHQKNFEKLKF